MLPNGSKKWCQLAQKLGAKRVPNGSEIGAKRGAKWLRMGAKRGVPLGAKRVPLDAIGCHGCHGAIGCMGLENLVPLGAWD